MAHKNVLGPSLSRRDFMKAATVATGAVLLAACAPEAVQTAVAGLTPESIATVTKPEFPIPTPPPPETSPTPSIGEIKVPSPYVAAGLYIGTYGEVDGKPITEGGVSVEQFKAAGHESQGFSHVSFGNGESRSVTLYLDEEGKREVPAAMMVSQDWLDTSFNAKAAGNRKMGTLPNGNQAEKEGTSWYLLDTEGKRTGETFVTVLPNRKSAKFGWPLLAMKGDELYVGLADGAGNLLDGEDFHPAFQQPKAIAQNEAQYMGDVSQLAGLGIDYDGKMRLRNIKGDILETVKYIGDSDRMFGKWVEESIQDTDFDTSLQAAQKTYATAVGKNEATLTLDTQLKVDREGRPYAQIVDKEDNGDTPLMITNMEKGEWANADPGGLASVKGKQIGISVAGGDKTSGEAMYGKRVKMFNTLMPPAAFSELYMGQNGNPENWLKMAKDNGQHLIVHAAFGKRVPEGVIADEQYATNRIESIFLALKKSGIKDFSMILANEPFICGYGGGNGKWNANNPYYKDMGGKNWIRKAYNIVYTTAQKYNLTPGVDFNIIGLNGAIPLQNGKSKKANEFYITNAKEIKEGIAQDLGVIPEEVNFDIGLNMYVGIPASSIDQPIPIEDVMDQATCENQIRDFTSYSNSLIGPSTQYWLNEFAINAGVDFDLATIVTDSLLTPLVKNLEGVTFFNPLSKGHLGDDPSRADVIFPSTLFGESPKFTAEAPVYALNRALNSLS